MREWRKAHPRATFTEIETTLDVEMARVRAQMLEELALDSASADWRGKEASERPKCPLCGTAMQANGEHKRQLVTNMLVDVNRFQLFFSSVLNCSSN